MGSLQLDEYQTFAVKTLRTHVNEENRLNFLLLGFSGEIGSLLSELKKKQRDRNSYVAYSKSAQEETGDVLWYLANVADHMSIALSTIALDGPPADNTNATFAQLQPQAVMFTGPQSNANAQRSLLDLAALGGQFVHLARRYPTTGADIQLMLKRVFICLVSAADDAHISLEHAALANIEKILGRWPIERNWGRLLDEDDDPDEQLPRRIEVTFREREVGSKLYVFQSIRGINVGDRLTDNSAAQDDYRFHDVFHLSFATYLGWSPVLRALLKVKRKSRPDVDEQEDGARAVITEEGISNWIFSHGLRHGAFEHVDSLDFASLKTIAQMVKGYEVQDEPLWKWEVAIFKAFEVFRELRRYRGGVVVADLNLRALTFIAPKP